MICPRWQSRLAAEAGLKPSLQLSVQCWNLEQLWCSCRAEPASPHSGTAGEYDQSHTSLTETGHQLIFRCLLTPKATLSQSIYWGQFILPYFTFCHTSKIVLFYVHPYIAQGCFSLTLLSSSLSLLLPHTILLRQTPDNVLATSQTAPCSLGP